MLTREKIALKVLEEAGGSLPRTVLVKLLFLLRMETTLTKNASFYDFVPYKYGPYSFALYRDLYRLESYGFVSQGNSQFVLNEKLADETQRQTSKLARNLQLAIANVYERYGQETPNSLVRIVYDKYPWYAINSEHSARMNVKIPLRPKATSAVYTVGYEGKSVDAFFNFLLDKGIETVVDVRANPVSRKYGFSGSRMKQIGGSLGIGYQHFPNLGVPSRKRAILSDIASRERLFEQYEQSMLVNRKQEIRDVAKLMSRLPSVLVCVERDVNCCHRGRLSHVIANDTGMEVINL